MLVHRLRRWPNIKPASSVFMGMVDSQRSDPQTVDPVIIPENTRRSPDVVLLLAHCEDRGPD